MRRTSLFAVALLVATAPSIALADFVPGRLYAPRYTPDCPGCPEAIWEFDPLTGSSRMFADLSPFGTAATGLAFTPDGSGLRVSVRSTNSIVEFDGGGVGRVVLDADDGIGSPVGSNNLAYDPFGNFFVVNSAPNQILRFPPDGGAATVFSDAPGGSYGSIAPAPDGSLYYTPVFTTTGGLYHILTFGAVVLIDGTTTGTLATARNGDVFLLNSLGIYRYPRGDGNLRELLAPPLPNILTGFASITISDDQSTLYVNNHFGSLYSIDAVTGDSRTLGRFPGESQFSGYGLAVAAPEPSSLSFLLVGVFHVLRRNRKTKMANAYRDHLVHAHRQTVGGSDPGRPTALRKLERSCST